MEKKSIKDVLKLFSERHKKIEEPIEDDGKKKFNEFLKKINKPFNSENRPRIKDGNGAKLKDVLEKLKNKHESGN